MQHVSGATFTEIDCARWCYILDVAKTVIDKNLISLRNIFPCFQMVLAKYVANEAVTNEYTSLIIYAMNDLSIILHQPWIVWQYLFQYAFMEQHFMLTELFFVPHVQICLLNVSPVKWELWKQVGGMQSLKQIWQVCFRLKCLGLLWKCFWNNTV